MTFFFVWLLAAVSFIGMISAREITIVSPVLNSSYAPGQLVTYRFTSNTVLFADVSLECGGFERVSIGRLARSTNLQVALPEGLDPVCEVVFDYVRGYEFTYIFVLDSIAVQLVAPEGYDIDALQWNATNYAKVLWAPGQSFSVNLTLYNDSGLQYSAPALNYYPDSNLTSFVLPEWLDVGVYAVNGTANVTGVHSSIHEATINYPVTVEYPTIQQGWIAGRPGPYLFTTQDGKLYNGRAGAACFDSHEQETFLDAFDFQTNVPGNYTGTAALGLCNFEVYFETGDYVYLFGDGPQFAYLTAVNLTANASTIFADGVLGLTAEFNVEAVTVLQTTCTANGQLANVTILSTNTEVAYQVPNDIPIGTRCYFVTLEESSNFVYVTMVAVQLGLTLPTERVFVGGTNMSIQIDAENGENVGIAVQVTCPSGSGLGPVASFNTSITDTYALPASMSGLKCYITTPVVPTGYATLSPVQIAVTMSQAQQAAFIQSLNPASFIGINPPNQQESPQQKRLHAATKSHRLNKKKQIKLSVK